MNLRGLTRKPLFGSYPTIGGITSIPSATLRSFTSTGNANMHHIDFSTDLQTKIYTNGIDAGIGISSSQLNIFNPTTWTTSFIVNSVSEMNITSSGIAIPNGAITFTGLADVENPFPHNLTRIRYPKVPFYYEIPFNTTFYYDYTLPTGHKQITAYGNLQTVNGLEYPHLKFISGATVFSTNYYGVTQGMGTNTDHTGGLGILLWENSWSTAHSISYSLTLTYGGLLDTTTEPKGIWYYHGGSARNDATFACTIDGVFLVNSTTTITKIRVQTNAATDRLAGSIGYLTC